MPKGAVYRGGYKGNKVLMPPVIPAEWILKIGPVFMLQIPGEEALKRTPESGGCFLEGLLLIVATLPASWRPSSRDVEQKLPPAQGRMYPI